MRHTFLTTLAAAAILTWGTDAAAQGRKPLDHSVYDGWQRIEQPSITPDGNIISYQINPQEGDGKLIIKDIASEKEITVDRGYSLRISPDGKMAVCLVKPFFAQTYKARRAKEKDLPADSLAIIDLVSGNIHKTEGVKSYETGADDFSHIAYTAAGSAKKNILVVMDTKTFAADSMKHVTDQIFNWPGTLMAAVVEKDKKDSTSVNALILKDFAKGRTDTLSAGLGFYGSPAFNRAGDNLIFLASSDTLKDGNRHCGLWFHDGNGTREILPQGSTDGLPQGWTINENSDPIFSGSGKRIWLGAAPFVGPADTTLADFEKPRVDVWHYADPYMQPQQKLMADRLKKFTYQAVMDADGSDFRLLTTSMFDDITPLDEGDSPYALSTDETSYVISSMWTTEDRKDLSIIDLRTGERTMIAKNLYASSSVSPDGKYVIWFNEEDSQWYTFNIATRKTVCLTSRAKVNFYDEDDDHPRRPEAYDYRPAWTEGDASVIINDRYDVWEFDPDGAWKKHRLLSDGYGRKNKLQLRHTDWTEYGLKNGALAKRMMPLKKGIVKSGGEIALTVFDEAGKKNGLAVATQGKEGRPKIAVLDTFAFPLVRKAAESQAYMFEKGNFRNPYDIYFASGLGQEEKKLSAINPQQAEYRWGHPELVHWKAYDGTPLDGLLYIPDGIDKSKKYPVMIYFYERNSETMYNYIQPAPSASIINISFFCSRGYLVFVPDIVYKDGHPGESAYNCIVSGAEAVCDRFPYADRANMAIQGQSWGGYQTAYLITRTNLFKAAGAGAPVSNMTSAYGGIRWESGYSRSGQYEHGQSRIGKSLWDEGGLELYLENSPLFRADKVETPVLIMHNDADGAVPWYQGIEYYVALRRNGKKVWLLEYNDEAHNLRERKNRKDLSVRLSQFFDHYLKGEPAPDWMTKGVPVTEKGREVIWMQK